METKEIKLSDIRGALIRQEETIIFALIERAQFARNKACYKRDGSEVLGSRTTGEARFAEMSFMEYFLVETETLHAKLGRYKSPDENAFFAPLLPNSEVSTPLPTSPLKPNRININDEVMGVYVNLILDELCQGDDDGEYGSTCACDIAVLQALSKRIHYGKFVAEAKFQAERERFTKLIQDNDADGIMDALTNIEVEDKVVERVRNKASRYGVDGTESSTDSNAAYKVNPDVIAKLYRDYLIPLNKKVQVSYLLQRLDRPSFAFVEKSDGDKAATKKFTGTGVPCATIKEVFLAIARNHVAYGVVPIQSAGVGFIKETQQALLTSKLRVCDCITHENSPADWTRYYVITTSKLFDGGLSEHLVAIFGVPHEPGSLVTALKALDGVNLSALESLPKEQKGQDFHYTFFCEIEGKNMDSNAIQQIIHKLQQVTTFVELVGAYSKL